MKMLKIAICCDLSFVTISESTGYEFPLTNRLTCQEWALSYGAGMAFFYGIMGGNSGRLDRKKKKRKNGVCTFYSHIQSCCCSCVET